jgi:hypothetical protein
MNTHSEYAILVAFPRKQCLHRRSSFLHYICIACLVFPWWHTKIRTENWNIQGVFKKMLVQTWCMSSAHQNSSYQCMLANSFRGTASTFAQPQACRCLSIKTLDSLVYSPPIEHEETLYQLTLGGCQTFVTTPGHVTGSDSPWLFMAMQALIQVEDAYELIFHSICNFCLFLPQIKQLYCTLLHVYAS